MPIDYSGFAFPKPSAAKRQPEPKKLPPKKVKPSREVTDKTTGEKRLVLSDADWAKLRKNYWRTHEKIKCAYCGREIKNWDDFTLDHSKPRGMGAARRDDSRSNLQPMHFRCNTKKGSKR